MFASTDNGPGLPLASPGGCVQFLGILGIHGEPVRPYAIGGREHLLPRVAPVGRAENAALFVFAKGPTRGGRKHAVPIPRIHDQSANLSAVLQANELPGRPGIGGFVHTPPSNDIAPNAVRPGPGVDHAGVGRSNLDGPDRSGRQGGSVGNVRPGLAVVRRFPHPAAHASHVKGEGMIFVAGHRRHPPAAGGPDHPILQIAVERWVDGDVGVRWRILGLRRCSAKEEAKPHQQKAFEERKGDRIRIEASHDRARMGGRKIMRETHSGTPTVRSDGAHGATRTPTSSSAIRPPRRRSGTKAIDWRSSTLKAEFWAARSESGIS